MEYAVVVQKLIKHFGKVTALNGLDLKIPTGTIFGLVGPNGAGKTTTFNILCGFVKAHSGSAQILGLPLANHHQLLGRIGVIPQDSQPYLYRTALDQLIYFSRLMGYSKTESRSLALKNLKDVQLEDRSREKVKNLSHGMRKRFDIAQAFLGQPELVFLDEPTSGLDPENAFRVRQLISSFRKKATIVYSSHNLAEVEQICDEVGIIKSGQLVRSGSIADITQSAQYLNIHVTATQVMLDKILIIPGIKTAQYLPEQQQIQISYDAKISAPENILTQVLDCLVQQKILIRDIQKGKSLEESYLNT